MSIYKLILDFFFKLFLYVANYRTLQYLLTYIIQNLKCLKVVNQSLQTFFKTAVICFKFTHYYAKIRIS